MRALLTGGAGFIGSHVADALLAAGHDVAVLDDLSSGRRENVPTAAQFFEADIRDRHISDIFAEVRPEILCHHAAQMDVRRSVADPIFDAHVNVVGSLQLFELCRQFGTRRVIFASTGGAMYGDQTEFPAPETHPENPLSPYGVAKLAVEKYLGFYAAEYGFRAASLRYANVYGPRQNPHGEAGVVAIFCDQLLAGRTPRIYGDGEQTRDYVYIGDVVRANMLALERDLTGAFNVGTGVETSVNQLYAALARELAPDVAAEHAPARPGEQKRSSLDSRRLADAAGWRPEVSLEAGLAATASYFRETSSAAR